MDLHDRAFDRELAALLLEQPRAFHQLALVDLALDLGRVEQRQRRQRVAAHAALDRRARGGVALAERQRRRRGTASRLARGDGRRVRGPAWRRGRRGATSSSSSVAGATSLAFALARAARAAARATCAASAEAGSAPCFLVCLAITSRRCASLRRSSRHVRNAAQPREPASAPASKAAVARSAERELRREDHGEHEQRDHDDDRAGPIEVGAGGAANPLAHVAAGAEGAPADLRVAQHEAEERRQAADKQRRADRLGVARIHGAAPEVVPAQHAEDRRDEKRGVAEQLERHLGDKRADQADEVGRACASVPTVKNHTGSLGS